MKNYFLLILLISVSLVSCIKVKKTDFSLTPSEYLELGMPHYDSIWSMNDYSNAFFAINKVKYDEPKALPTRDSKKSGVIFSRMISMDNLSFLQDETLPLWVKADKIKWFVNTLIELKVAYTIIGVETQYYNRELMDMDIFRVNVAQKMLDLGKEINESDDPSDVSMQGDYPHIQLMYLNILVELFEEQQRTSEYPEQTLELLADSLSTSVRRNMDWFDADASARIKQAMHSVMESTSSRKIKKDYKELSDIL